MAKTFYNFHQTTVEFIVKKAERGFMNAFDTQRLDQANFNRNLSSNTISNSKETSSSTKVGGWMLLRL